MDTRASLRLIRTKNLWVKYDSISILKGEGTTRMEVRAVVNKVAYRAVVYGSLEQGTKINDHSIRLTEGKNDVWNSIKINRKDKTAFDMNGVQLI